MSTPLSLPARPDLNWLKNRAKERLSELRGRDPAARLADAQREIARDYGFPSWRALKARVDEMRAAPATESHPGPESTAPTDEVVQAFLEAVGSGELAKVERATALAPSLVNAVGPHPFWGGRPQALHVSIETNRRELFDLLLERGADVNGERAEYMGWTPLLLSVHWKQPDMTRVLMERGARIGLAEALALRDDARVDAILDRDGAAAVVGPAPNDGTFLHLARTTHAIDRLLALGVPLDRKDHWGADVIEALSRSGPEGAPLVAHLVARGAHVGPAELARIGDRVALERLFAADPAAVRAPVTLKAAVDFGHHDLARWLIDHGGDVNGRTGSNSNETPLHSAAWNGDLAMARLLVEAGADLQARDSQYDGMPLDWAKKAIEVTNNPRCAEVVELLQPLTNA